MIVYCATNKLNGKRYVGQTVRPLAERWRDHCRVKDDNYFHRAIHKYGAENFDVQVIDTAKSVEELDVKEMHWIETLGTLFPSGYNLREGGNVSGRGRIGILNRKSRLIYQFRLDGSMVNGYYGTHDAHVRTGLSAHAISQALRRGNLCGGCVWVLATEFDPQKLVKKIDSYHGNRWRKVVCVETGEVFRSMSEAAQKYDTAPSSISACCAGRLKTTAKLHWKYYEEGEL